MTLALAVLGVVALGVAAFFLLKQRRPPESAVVRTNNVPGTKEDAKTPTKVPNIPVEVPKTTTPATPLDDAELSKLSNLLPNDTEHVQHWFLKDIFAPSGFIFEAAFKSPGALDGVTLARKLGFAPTDVDDAIRAERYTAPSWRYAVLHFKNAVKESELKAALNLRLAGAPIQGQTYYKMTEPHPVFDVLAQFSFGVPARHQAFASRRLEPPTFLRLYNAQTLIVGDEAPVVALLKAKGEFKPLSPRTAPPPSAAPATPKTSEPDAGPKGKPDDGPRGKAKPRPGGQSARLTPPWLQTWGTSTAAPRADRSASMHFVQAPAPNQDQQPPADPSAPQPPKAPVPPARFVRDDMYLTIRPALKAILDRMEARTDKQDRVLISSCVDMEAARVETKLPEFRDRVARRPRQFWDITLMLREPTPRIRLLGTTLLQHGELPRYQLRNEMSCSQDGEAAQIKKEIVDSTSFAISQFFKQFVNHEVRLPPLPQKEVKPAPAPEPAPATADTPSEPKKPAPINASQMTVNQQAAAVEFVLELVLDNATLNQLQGITLLTAASLRAQIEAAVRGAPRHVLGKAAHTAAVKGMSDRDVPSGRFPPGAFPRAKTPFRTDQEPRNRISWLASLLPYMGQQHLYNRLQFDQSWREPSNWLPGHAIVPQFLAPSYPDYLCRVPVGELPIDFGATHYVGMAGVGLDAASYNRSDPASASKRGIFGYDGSASLAEIQKGRGLANTIAMIQIPYDGDTGVSPWIAGGGATLRGVPEKNAIAPFVLSKDQFGRPIEHKGKRGAYVLMADGSVRFVEQSVSDEVFKAMCTVQGPTPENFNPNTNPLTPLVPPPEKWEDAPLPVKPSPPEKKSPPVVSGNVPPAKQPNPSDRHQGAGRIHDKSQGFSIVPPPGWQRDTTTKVPGAVKPFMIIVGPKSIFTPNISILAMPGDGTPIEKVPDQIRKGYAAAKRTILDDGLVTMDGKKAYRVNHRGPVAVNGKNMDATAIQYFVYASNNRMIIMTFSASPDAFDGLRAAFETSAQSARID